MTRQIVTAKDISPAVTDRIDGQRLVGRGVLGVGMAVGVAALWDAADKVTLLNDATPDESLARALSACDDASNITLTVDGNDLQADLAAHFATVDSCVQGELRDSSPAFLAQDNLAAQAALGWVLLSCSLLLAVPWLLKRR
ncbi:MAG: hypothetical protein GC136_00235 [Alphaproteobacteria bacterium]|nr:hypothetical protein [Alphaproteobacteria bacterium]